jgi:hypothetical protein
MENNMTKEQYLSIKASWKKFIADGRHKKYKQPYIGIAYGPYRKIECFYWKSDLVAIHHYVYALIRRRDPKTIFSEASLNTVEQSLRWYRHRSSESDIENHVKPLLAPFGEDFTFDMFKELVAKV